MAVIYFAGGCFWGMERYLASVRGVLSTRVGYANGKTEDPTYEDVCRRDTGHAETVEVTYDPAAAPLPFLLELYFAAVDPHSLNRQGHDVGTQYRTGVYYVDEADAPVVEKALSDLQKRVGGVIRIESGPMKQFFEAEEYHQDYLEKNPGGYCHIGPALFEKAEKARPAPASYEKPDKKSLRERLTDLQYAVTQENATEPPFRNDFWDDKREGLYVDITTGEPLFSSRDKFDSGCGWPSFTKPVEPDAAREKEDRSHGMRRTEVRSRAGDAHLGHVFPDGPTDRGGLRYCINSAALRFIPKEELAREGYGKWLSLFE